MFFSRLMARRLERGRRLHRGEREDLEQVGHDHVAVGAGRLVEVAALGQAERLGHVDLDVGDVVPVPDRLEQAVGEAEGEDVLGRLLAQEVVDPEDLLLVEDLVQLGVERDGRGVVGAERLLHDDPAAHDQAGLEDGAHRGERGLRRHRQVVQPLVDVTGQQLLGPGDGLAQGERPGRERHEVEALGELVPVGVAHLAGAVLADGDQGQVAERVGGHLVEGGPHDAQVLDEPGLEQVQQAGDQLALGEVPGGAEQDEGGGRGHGGKPVATQGRTPALCRG